MLQQIFSRQLRFTQNNGQAYPNWEVKKLGEIAIFFSGGTPKSTNKSLYNGAIPFIGSGDIKKKSVKKYITSIALRTSSAKLVNKGDLLYALYGATSGETAISKMEGAINQAVLCIRTSENKHYLYQLLIYKKETIITKYLQGGQGNLSAQIIKNLSYAFPSLAEQEKIGNFLGSIDSKINNLRTRLMKVQQFKKGLLQQLFV